MYILFVPVVSLLYGDNPSYALSAAVLGHSLRKAKTKHDMVLMYTDDVENVWLSICRSAGWTLRLVKHIKFQKELYPTGRFPHVFTKLHAVGMEKYDKVIVPEPFERQTPAAVRRHPQGHSFDGQRNQIGGINAEWKCSWQQGDISAGQVLLRKMSTWFTFLGRSTADIG